VTDVTDRLAGMAPSERTLLGYLFWLSRPRFWLYLAGPVIVGVVYAAESPGDVFSPLAVALFAYFLVPANIFLYGVNDLFDADVDQYNPKKSEEGREVQYTGQRTVTTVIIASGALGLAFVPVLPVEALAGLAGFLVLGTAYSAPPLRLKTTPGLDSLSNGLYVLPAVVAFGALTDSAPPVLAVAGGWVWAMGMHTFSAIPDIEPDRAAGIQTTATLLGQSRTFAYCAGCWLVATALMWLVHPLLAALFTVYPLFIAGIVLGNVDVDRAYWWFPIVNSMVGMVLTLGGIWRVTYA
jgi:4-hydroxybenzoate polyprenyltransferase